MNNKAALFIAVILGSLSVVGIQMYIDKIKSEVKAGKELMDAWVTVREIDRGETLTEADITKVEMPAEFVRKLASTQVSDSKLIIKSKTQSAISANQIIQNHHINAQRGSSQGLDIGGGFRAITVKVDPVSGVAGMIRPGDFVDLIGCFETDGMMLEGIRIPQLTTLLLPKLKVLAVDARVDRNSKDRRFGYNTVTLRARPKDVTRIVHASTFGKIMLALVKDDDPAATRLYPITSKILLGEAAKEMK